MLTTPGKKPLTVRVKRYNLEDTPFSVPGLDIPALMELGANFFLAMGENWYPTAWVATEDKVLEMDIRGVSKDPVVFARYMCGLVKRKGGVAYIYQVHMFIGQDPAVVNCVGLSNGECDGMAMLAVVPMGIDPAAGVRVQGVNIRDMDGSFPQLFQCWKCAGTKKMPSKTGIVGADFMPMMVECDSCDVDPDPAQSIAQEQVYDMEIPHEESESSEDSEKLEN